MNLCLETDIFLCKLGLSEGLCCRVIFIIIVSGYSRYTDEESSNFMLEAGALDHRFKSLPFHSKEEREAVCSRLVT